MTPVLSEMITTCAVCGEVACERDLYYVDKDDEVDGCRSGDVVCTDCAGETRSACPTAL